MKNVSAPMIRIGMQIAYTGKAILGKMRNNLVVCVCNAILKAQITRGGSDQIFIAPTGGLVFQIKRTSDSTGGTTIALKTDGTDNGSQTTLNLKHGLGIILTDDGSGGITIAITDPDALISTHVLKLREWDVCVDDGMGGVTSKKALFLSSETY